jgi:hypothetical protein
MENRADVGVVGQPGRPLRRRREPDRDAGVQLRPYDRATGQDAVIVGDQVETLLGVVEAILTALNSASSVTPEWGTFGFSALKSANEDCRSYGVEDIERRRVSEIG